MASTFIREDSSFIWIRYKTADGKWKAKATGYRKDNLGDRRQAEQLARNTSRTERERKSAHASEQWDSWVDRWLRDRYAGKDRTFSVYHRYWRRLREWLNENGIVGPSQIIYRHAAAYREARAAAGGKNNTVVYEIKFLALVMGESVRLGFVGANPLRQMQLRKDPPKEKVPWTDDAIAAVAKAVRTQPLWMRATFVLGLYQAARMRQCDVPLTDIDWERGRITYRKVKGDKPFTQPLDRRAVPELRAIMEERRRTGCDTLCDIPEFPSIAWRELLDSLGLPHLVHHGLRVTWITRAAKSGGVSLAEAKRFCNHASTTIHAVYQKLNADDLVRVSDALNLPELPS